MIKNYLLNIDDFLNEALRYSKGLTQDKVSIVKKDIEEYLIDLLRIDKDSYTFIGSSGKLKKSEISYNVNLAISEQKLMDKNNLEENEIFDFIKSQLKRLNIKSDDSDGKIVFNWNLKKDFIEVRLQIVENLEWIKFSRHSPNLMLKESKYPGKYREAVFSAISKVAKKKIVSYFDTNENVKEYSTYRFYVDDGLCIVNKSFEGKNGKLKKAKLLESSKRVLTDDPKEFVKIIFGDKYKPEDVSTFEQCLKIIESKEFNFYKRRDEIKNRIKQELINLNLSVPEILE